MLKSAGREQFVVFENYTAFLFDYILLSALSFKVNAFQLSANQHTEIVPCK